VADPICVAVFGRRGFGKSTLVQSLTRGAPRAVAYDPVGEYHRALGWARADTVADVVAHFKTHWRHGFRVALTIGGDHIASLHRLSLFLWEAQRHYETGADRRPLVLVVEEMNLSVPNHAIAAYARGFLSLVLQGRHRGVGIVGVSQRPSLVSADFRSMVEARYTFGLGEPSDALAFPREYRETILTLPPHHYLKFGGGRVETGQNRRRAG